MVGPYATAVDAHFAATEQAVEATLRHSRQLLAQEIVDPLPCPFGVDANFAHSGPLADRWFS
jgi:hypothetical protein